MPGSSIPPGRPGRIAHPGRDRRPAVPPAVRPTPAEEITATTAGEFVELLRLLQVRSGVTAGDIARRSGIARSQVYALIERGRRVLPTQLPHVHDFAQACGLTAAQVALVEALWAQLREAADQPRPASPPSTLELAESAAAGAPRSPLPALLQNKAPTQPVAQPRRHNVSVDDLFTEIIALRRGRGMIDSRIDDRVGSALRVVCGVADSSSPGEVRRLVSARLTELADQLPQDLRYAALGAIALLPDARQPFYQDRIRWVAVQIDRDERTVRRRADDAFRQLARLAVAELGAISTSNDLTNDQGPAWYTEELRVALVLDEPNPTAFEVRQIVSNQDGLDEIDLAFTLTAPPDLGAKPVDPARLNIAMLYGGRLVTRDMASARRFLFSVMLGRPLERNQRAEFALRFQVPAGQAMQPHYVCVPRERCELFDLRVRFDQEQLPSAVWQLAKTFQSDLDDPASHGTKVELDTNGELFLRFADLAPGFAYGASWDTAPSPESAERSGFQSH